MCAKGLNLGYTTSSADLPKKEQVGHETNGRRAITSLGIHRTICLT